MNPDVLCPINVFALFVWAASIIGVVGAVAWLYLQDHRGFSDRQRFFLFCGWSSALIFSAYAIVTSGFTSSYSLGADFRTVVENTDKYASYIVRYENNWTRKQKGIFVLKLYGKGDGESITVARRIANSLGTGETDQMYRMSAVLAAGMNRQEAYDLLKESRPDKLDPIVQYMADTSNVKTGPATAPVKPGVGKTEVSVTTDNEAQVRKAVAESESTQGVTAKIPAKK